MLLLLLYLLVASFRHGLEVVRELIAGKEG